MLLAWSGSGGGLASAAGAVGGDEGDLLEGRRDTLSEIALVAVVLNRSADTLIGGIFGPVTIWDCMGCSFPRPGFETPAVVG